MWRTDSLLLEVTLHAVLDDRDEVVHVLANPVVGEVHGQAASQCAVCDCGRAPGCSQANCDGCDCRVDYTRDECMKRAMPRVRTTGKGVSASLCVGTW